MTNEPVEKVTFLKSASSAGSKIGNDHFLSPRLPRFATQCFVSMPFKRIEGSYAGAPISSFRYRVSKTDRSISLSIGNNRTLCISPSSPPKRSPLSFPLLIWRYYHAFKTFSTASTRKASGGRRPSAAVSFVRPPFGFL